MALLEVRHLQKIYQNRFGGNQVRALSDVNFSVEQGEYVAIMGESGSGKTTLLNILAALDTPTLGEVLLNGENMKQIPGGQMAVYRRENLGFVFQDFNLLDTLTLEENIALPLTLGSLSPEAIEKKVKNIADRLQLADALKKFPFQVSGGQKQRCAFARAMVCDPKLVMADEPTGSLDSHAARMLLTIMAEQNRERNATILMVTHDAFCASFSNRILFLKDGRIFNEIRRGNRPQDAFYHSILDVLSLLGGDLPC